MCEKMLQQCIVMNHYRLPLLLTGSVFMLHFIRLKVIMSGDLLRCFLAGFLAPALLLTGDLVNAVRLSFCHCCGSSLNML